uniref:Transposase n=1 Tax=Timema bartmani TaxID=61472 RepID=A0A7R9EWR8_9NEOP|nr:unnamed protein product [Timema bartmani]
MTHNIKDDDILVLLENSDIEDLSDDEVDDDEIILPNDDESNNQSDSESEVENPEVVPVQPEGQIPELHVQEVLPRADLEKRYRQENGLTEKDDIKWRTDIENYETMHVPWFEPTTPENRNCFAAGTIRVNRFHKPPLLSDKDMHHQQERGFAQEVVSEDGQVVLKKWYDNRAVTLASNFVGIGETDNCRRWDKTQKEYINVPRPEVVQLYNKNMGGVDTLDFLISLYRIYIKSRKWPLRMFAHAVDLALVNSWLEYKQQALSLGIDKRKMMDLLMFRHEVAEGLILAGKPVPAKKRGCTLKLVQEATSKGEINDTNLYLQPFCKNVEQVFQKGLVCNYSALGFTKSAESWHWMKQLDLRDGSSSSYEASVKMVGSCNKAVSPRGKLRLLIRTCLVNKCLHVPVQILVRKKHPRGVYDPVRSILGDEILGEIFLSVLLQCSRLVFRLNLNNSVFLDECWELPDCLALELVPSKALGICVTFVGGKALVAGIKRTSVAAEDGKVCVGDILEELNGNHVTTSSHGKLGAIMRKGSGKPITATHDLPIPEARKGLYQPRTEVKQTFHARHTDEEHCSEVKRADISHTRHTTRHIDEEHPTEVKREDVSHMEHRRRINQAHHSKTGDLYPPIINLLHQARLDPDDVRAKQLAALHGDVCLDDALIMNGHEVTYLNCVSTGTHGDVRVIEQGMNLVLQGHTQKINSKVLFECQEMAVSVTDVATNKLSFYQ